MSAPSNRLLRRLAASSMIVLGLGCTPGLGHIKWQIRDQVQREQRLFTMCQTMGVDPGQTARLPSFLGDDPAALGRIEATWTGIAPSMKDVAKFDPWDEMHRALVALDQLVVAALAKETSKADIDRMRALADRLRVAKGHASSVQTRWTSLTDMARQVVGLLGRREVLPALNQCAEQELRQQASIDCAFKGADAISAWAKEPTNVGSLDGTVRALYKDVDLITEDVRLIGAALRDIQNEEGSALRNADLLKQGKFALRELTAIDGLMRDGQNVLTRLLAIGKNPARALAEIGLLLIGAEGDRVADLALLWLAEAVGKIDEAIAKLDAQSYGAASAIVGFALETEAVDEAICAAADEVTSILTTAGLHRGSLGARVCRSAVGSPSDFPKSTLLARIYEALVGAAQELPCAMKEKEATVGTGSAAPPTQGARRRPTRVAFAEQTSFWSDAPGARAVEMQAQSLTHALARATWDARLQMADSALARLSSPSRFTKEDTPLLQDIPRGLGAALLLVEHREQALLSIIEERDALERFLSVQRILMSLAYAARPDIRTAVCHEQRRAKESSVDDRTLPLPPQCTDGSEREARGGDPGALAEAVRQVAWEICGINRRTDLKAQAEALCAAVKDPRPPDKSPVTLDCEPKGYEALIVPSAIVFRSGEFPRSDQPCGNNSEVAKVTCGLNAVADRLKVVLPSSSKPTATPLRLRFTGSASQPWADPNLGRDYIISAIAAENYENDCSAAYDELDRIIQKNQITKSKGYWSKSDYAGTLACNCKGTICEGKVLQKISPAAPGLTVTRLDIKHVIEYGRGHSYLSLTPFLANGLLPSHWVIPVVDKAIQQAKASNDNVTDSDALRSAANAVLSMLRALGTAEVVLKRAGDLCTVQNPCLIEAYGSVLADKNDPVHRAVGVAVTSGHDVPRCVGLAPPGNIHLLPTEEQP